jgi:hypothetical protein
MDASQAEARVRRFKAAVDLIEAARKGILASYEAGLQEIDAALEAQRASLLDYLEDVVAVPWWNPADLPHLSAILDLSSGLLGLYRGGPVFRLGVKLGELCKPYEEPVDV